MNSAAILASFRLIADDRVVPYLWDDAEVMGYAAEGELEAARRSRLIKDRSTAITCVYAVTAGQRSITLEPRVIFARDVRIASKELPLRAVRAAMLDVVFPNWDTTLDLGDVNHFAPDRESGKIWFDAPFPADDTVTLTVIREPLQALTTGLPVSANVSLDVGGLGPLDVAAAIPGTAFNGRTLTFTGATGAGNESRALSVVLGSGGNLVVTLATDAAGAYDDTANTFPLIADAGNAAALGIYQFTDNGDGTDVVNAAQVLTFAGGSAAGAAVNPEIAPRYHPALVQWMLWRAFGKQDAETNDPARAAKALEAFELEFGKKSRAIDEVYINEQYAFDDFDGSF